MLRISRCSQISDFRQQIQTKIFFLNIRIYPAFGKNSLLADIHLGNLLCPGHFHISFVSTVIANAFETVNLWTLRHMDVNNCFAIIPDSFRTNIKRRIQQIRIIGNIDDIADNLFNRIFRNADNFSVVSYTQKNISAQAVKKRANRFKGIALCSIASTLELNAGCFSCIENIFQCFCIHQRLRIYYLII